MSNIDRILGHTPTGGPQIHASGKHMPARPAPITEMPAAAGCQQRHALAAGVRYELVAKRLAQVSEKAKAG